jgi:hypothetical protein
MPHHSRQVGGSLACCLPQAERAFDRCVAGSDGTCGSSPAATGTGEAPVWAEGCRALVNPGYGGRVECFKRGLVGVYHPVPGEHPEERLGEFAFRGSPRAEQEATKCSGLCQRAAELPGLPRVRYPASPGGRQ